MTRSAEAKAPKEDPCEHLLHQRPAQHCSCSARRAKHRRPSPELYKSKIYTLPLVLKIYVHNLTLDLFIYIDWKLHCNFFVLKKKYYPFPTVTFLQVTTRSLHSSDAAQWADTHTHMLSLAEVLGGKHAIRQVWISTQSTLGQRGDMPVIRSIMQNTTCQKGYQPLLRSPNFHGVMKEKTEKDLNSSLEHLVCTSKKTKKGAGEVP